MLTWQGMCRLQNVQVLSRQLLSLFDIKVATTGLQIGLGLVAHDFQRFWEFW